MKYNKLIITFFAIAGVVVGCVVGCHKEQTASEQLDKVKAETKAAAQDLKDYTFAQKTEFAAKMQSELDTLNKELDQLSTKVEKSSDAVKADAKPKLQALREQTAQLNKQLDNVRNSTESTWDSVKAASQKAFDSLKDGFQQSRQWASNKIAP
jgi:uncharacterized membrane-anchored protein YhcB (DUF1043 family)